MSAKDGLRYAGQLTGVHEGRTAEARERAVT